VRALLLTYLRNLFSNFALSNFEKGKGVIKFFYRY